MYSFSFEIILNIFEIKRMTLIPKMNHSRFFIITLIDIIIKGMYNFLIRTANNLDPISFYSYHLLFFNFFFKKWSRGVQYWSIIVTRKKNCSRQIFKYISIHLSYEYKNISFEYQENFFKWKSYKLWILHSRIISTIYFYDHSILLKCKYN